jgi:hypothetical protein
MFRPISECFSTARTFLPAVVSRSASFELSNTYRVLTNYPRLSGILEQTLHSEKAPWEGNVTSLHLIARFFPTSEEGYLNGLKPLMGEAYPPVPPPYNANATKDLLESYAGIQDGQGNTPLHDAILRKAWPLAAFIAENSKIHYTKKNKAGDNVAWAMVKSMPCQLTTPHVPFLVPEHKTLRSLGVSLVRITKMEAWEKKDENGWGLAHWAAFRGFKKDELLVEGEKWTERDNQGVTPEDIEKLFQLISSEGIKGLSDLNSITFKNLPKERQAEFHKALQEKITQTALRMQHLLKALPSDLRKSEKDWVKSINV